MSHSLPSQIGFQKEERFWEVDRTCDIFFWPFPNFSCWWWLVSYLFLIRTSYHKITQANGYCGVWPGWGLQSVFPLTVWASLVAQTVKRLPTIQETWVWSLGWEGPLEKEIATHSSTVAWKIPWTEELGRLLSMGSQRIAHDWVISFSLFLNSLIEMWLPGNSCTSEVGFAQN